MAQTTPHFQPGGGGTSSSESSTPLSPEQQFDLDTKRAIALSLEATKLEEYQQRASVKSPTTSGNTNSGVSVRPANPQIPRPVSTVGSVKQATGAGSVAGFVRPKSAGNVQDPFSIKDEAPSMESQKDLDLMVFSFDHVLKNYDRQKTSQPQPELQQQQMPPPRMGYPMNMNAMTTSSAHTATLPGRHNQQAMQPNRTGFTGASIGGSGGMSQRPNLTHQQSLSQQPSYNPSSVFKPVASSSLSSNPFLSPNMPSNWSIKPESKYLKDLVFSTLPLQKSRSTPPSPTPRLMDDFLMPTQPPVSKPSTNPFTNVPHGQPLPRSAADELLLMFQESSPESPPDYMHPPPPVLPPKGVSVATETATTTHVKGSSHASSVGAVHLPPPASSMRRINSQPSIAPSLPSSQQKAPSNGPATVPAPPLPPKMYTNRAVTDILPIHPPKSTGTDLNDLIMWSPNSSSGGNFSFDDDFCEFDPIKQAALEERRKAALEESRKVAEALKEAMMKDSSDSGQPVDKSDGADVSDEGSLMRERPSSYSNTKETKMEKPTRPRTVHSAQPRPKSLEMGKAERWTSRGSSVKKFKVIGLWTISLQEICQGSFLNFLYM